MKYNVYDQNNQLIGQVEVSNAVEAWRAMTVTVGDVCVYAILVSSLLLLYSAIKRL